MVPVAQLGLFASYRLCRTSSRQLWWRCRLRGWQPTVWHTIASAL